VEAVGFLEALIRALGPGWAARYAMISPYGVYGVILTSDVGGIVEVVPSLRRGHAVIWSPFVFTRGTPHYELHADGRMLGRTPMLGEAVARLERWRAARKPAGRVAARLAKVGSRRPGRTTEVDVAPIGLAPRAAPAGLSITDVLRDGKPGQVERARKLARRTDVAEATRELLSLAREVTGDARADALSVLLAIATPMHGPELARYLDDPERIVQRVAIDGVKRTGYTPAVPALAQLVLGRDARASSGKSQLAASAAAAMKALSGKRGTAALTGYLSATDPRVREAACVALVMSTTASPGRQVRPLLERLLGDSDARVVKAARRALAK
jgi:HEAT repeat protein